jgi:alpha-tubulin suppressor-like RCC1 family protein
MSEDPIVEEEGPPDDEITDGALLFNPSMSIEDEDGVDEFRQTAPKDSKLGWIVTAILVAGVAAVAGYSALTDGPASTEALPPMVEPIAGATPLAETIVPVPSAEQEAPTNAEIQIGVRIFQRNGQAWGDTIVRFRVETGDGSLAEPLDVRSNADGLAVTTLTLPSRPSETVVMAGVPGSTLEEASIVARAIPGTPERIEIASGDDQEAEVGQLLPTRLVIRLTDAQGNPIPEASVQFRVASGNGLTAPSQTRTDSIGEASALWRLGSVAGPQRLVASTPYFEDEVTFVATATGQPGAAGTPEEPIEASAVAVVRNSLAVGGGHACRLDTGTLTCFGGNDRGQRSVQGETGLAAITAGASHTCGLDAEGVATCWGSNESGQLGDGTRSDRGAAVRVRTDLRFSMLSAGSQHTCGLAGGGVPLCWGLNLSGQLGDGTRNDQTLPRTVGGGISFQRLVSGWTHTCGLTSNGNAFCWGLNSQGQLGDGSRLDRLSPTLVRGAVQSLAAGSAHTCGISREVVLCWGSNTFGQLGDDTTEDSPQPVEVQGLPGEPVRLAAGAVHTCALIAGGRTFCWGQNLSGQLGDGTTTNRPSAVEVATELRFNEIYAGGAETCGATPEGDVYCWGLNSQGQLGDGTRVNRPTPTPLGG